MHAIQAPHKRGFSAARRPDQRRRLVCRDLQMNILQCVIRTVPGIQPDHFDANSHLERLSLH